MIIRMTDIRAAGMCSSGARAWFALHGICWSTFLKNGVDAEVILATGDALGQRVVEVASGQR